MDDGRHQIECENCLLREQIGRITNRFEEKITQLSTIREAGYALRYVNDFTQVCHTLLGVVLGSTSAQNCSIMLLDGQKNQLFLVAASDPQKSYMVDVKDVISRKGLIYTLKVGEGAAGQAVSQRESILVHDPSTCPYFQTDANTKVKVGSLLAVPLMVENTPIGVLNVSHSEPGVFHEKDVHLFNIMSNFIALVIHTSLEHERVKSSELKYRILSENSGDGIIIVQDDVHVYANPRYQELTGYNFQELQSMSFESLIAPSGPSEDDSTESSCGMHGETMTSFETTLVTKKGEKRWTEITASVIDYNGCAANMISVRDVTERKQLEKQLLQAQKMEAIGTLAGGIAHDFNNLLQAILGYGELLLRDSEKGGRIHAKLLQITYAARRGAELTHRLLTFSRGVEARMCPVDLNHQIGQLLDLLIHTIPRIIEIEVRPGNDLWPINADQSQIEQVLINLTINARDAMPDGGKLIIETMNQRIDEDHSMSMAELPPGEYVLLKLSDTGCGMDAETLEHVFEPFFTTKAVGKGTGLGLAIVYGIIKKHGGAISCTSRLQEGTTFSIYLPAMKPSAAS